MNRVVYLPLMIFSRRWTGRRGARLTARAPHPRRAIQRRTSPPQTVTPSAHGLGNGFRPRRSGSKGGATSIFPYMTAPPPVFGPYTGFKFLMNSPLAIARRRAARGGKHGRAYPWGDSGEKLHLRANLFEGTFPWKPTASPPDGAIGPNAVRSCVPFRV